MIKRKSNLPVAAVLVVFTAGVAAFPFWLVQAPGPKVITLIFYALLFLRYVMIMKN